MANRMVRAGIVGLGNIGQVHASCVQANPEIELVGGVDLTTRSRESFAEEFDVPTYKAPIELLEAGVDLVFVCTPNIAHSSLTIEALETGALVLCEKPPAIRAEEAERMAEVAERNLPKLRERFPLATGNLVYGLVYRHTLANYRPFLHPDVLGKATVVIAEWQRARGVPGRGLFTNLEASGGGAGIDLGCHVLDASWWGMGCPRPLWVSAITSDELAKTTEVEGYGPYNRAEFGVEGLFGGVVRFEDSMLFLRAAFTSNTPGLVEQASIFWDGSRAGFEFPLHTGDRDVREVVPRFRGERYGHMYDATLMAPQPLTVEAGYHRQVQHLADVLAGRNAPIGTPQEGLTLMRMLNGLYESAGTGRPVDL